MTSKDVDMFVCPICHVKVKRKMEKAHNVSRDHRQRLASLKAAQEKHKKLMEVEEQKQVDQTRKRPVDDADSDDEQGPSVSSKKVRTEDINMPSLAARQAEPEPPPEEGASALPSDFFENRTEEEKKKVDMDNEFDKFLSEVKEIDRKETEAAIVEDEADAVQRDLDMIDEQIEMWKKMNELEKQKETLLAETKARIANGDGMEDDNNEEEADEQADSDDGDDFDVFTMDWRARKV